MGERVNGNSGAVHSLPASPRSGVVERNRQASQGGRVRKQIDDREPGPITCSAVPKLARPGSLVERKLARFQKAKS